MYIYEYDAVVNEVLSGCRDPPDVRKHVCLVRTPNKCPEFVSSFLFRENENCNAKILIHTHAN